MCDSEIKKSVESGDVWEKNYQKRQYYGTKRRFCGRGEVVNLTKTC